MNRLTLSVVMITYKHGNLIEEAINSILIQETNFNFELIISDDNSPDDTNEIVEKIIKSHNKGDFIKYKKHSQNKGMMPNFIWALNQAKGEYIAICEGDDYWTDPQKLQKQVDFLETNNSFVLSFHNVWNLYSDGSKKEFYNYKNLDFKSSDLWDNWIIPTASVVFRNVLNFNELEKVSGTHGDLALFLLLGEYGQYHCINEIMGVYRIHDLGVTQVSFKTINHRIQHLEQLDKINEYFNRKYDKKIRIRSVSYCLSISYLESKNLEKKIALNYVIRSFKYSFIKSLTSKYFYATILNIFLKWK